MTSRGEKRRRDARATAIAAAAFAPMFAVLATGTSLGQDTSKSDSSWERAESVLVVPPVYLPDTSASADGCAEDCPSSIPPAAGDSPIAVSGSADNESNASAGTADDPRDESVAVGGYAADGSDWQQDRAAAARPQQGTGDPGNPLGSVQEYDERQAEAEQRGNYEPMQAPSVIIAVPAGAYAASGAASAPVPSPGAGVASSGVAASSRSFPSASWMPQPMARIAPLPPIVQHAPPQTMRVFPGGALPGPGAGGFGAGLSQMPGVGGGFGHR